jgi:hypothetical protein
MPRVCWKCNETINPTSHECSICRTPKAFANSPYASGFSDGHGDAEADWQNGVPGNSFTAARDREPRNGTPQDLGDYEHGYVVGYNRHWKFLTKEDSTFDFLALT